MRQANRTGHGRRPIMVDGYVRHNDLIDPPSFLRMSAKV
jgi:hypothetical protein